MLAKRTKKWLFKQGFFIGSGAGQVEVICERTIVAGELLDEAETFL